MSGNMDLTRQEQIIEDDLMKYLQTHGVTNMFSNIIETLLTHKPDNPVRTVKFIFVNC